MKTLNLKTLVLSYIIKMMIFPLNGFSQDFGEAPSFAGTEVFVTAAVSSDHATPDLEEVLSINYTKNRFEDIKLFPIPVRDHLNIRLNYPQSEQFFVDIFNIAGYFIKQYRVIDPQQPITLDLRSLPVGYFYARISDGTTQVTKKLLKIN